jgi:hypothetical protein
MFNLFFFTDVYGNDDYIFDFANVVETICTINNGIVRKTTIADTMPQNDKCTNFTDVPLCYSDSCKHDVY